LLAAATLFSKYVSFEVLTLMGVQIVAVRDVTLYNWIEYIFIVPEEGSSRFLQNAGTHLSYCSVSNLRTPLTL
jgi:hypothetical protein